jgi:hypothetical protein
MATSLSSAIMMLLVIFFVVSRHGGACQTANARIAASRAIPNPRHTALAPAVYRICRCAGM